MSLTAIISLPAVASAQPDEVDGTARLLSTALVVALTLVTIAALAALMSVRRRQRPLLEDLSIANQRARKFSELLAASPEPFLAINPGGQLDSHPALRQVLGLASEPKTLSDLAALITDDDAKSLADWIEQNPETGKSCQLSIEKDGEIRRVGAKTTRLISGAAERTIIHFCDLSDQNGRPDGLLAGSQQQDDITQALTEYEQISAHVSIPIWRRTKDLQLTWCNEAYGLVVGAPSTDAVAKGLEIETALIPNQARKLAANAIASQSRKFEIRNFVVDGQRRALEINEIPAADGIVGFARDVTDLLETQNELSRHIRAQSEVLNNLSTAIVIYGPDKQIDYFNQAFADLWRLERDWLATKPSHAEVLEKMRENRQLPEHADFLAYREQLFRHYTDLIEATEELIYKPDGRILRRIVTPHPFGGLMFVEEDVTDSLALERSYNTLIATQSETLDNLYEGVAVYGGDGRLKLFNSAFADIWHLSEDMLESEPHIGDVLEAARSLFQSDDWPSLKQELVAHATGRDRHALRLERSDQSTIDYGCVALPDGNALLTYVDITDTATIERALRERNVALEEADRLKTEFIANMSYELRTPLNSIIGFTDMLSNPLFGELNERQFGYIDNIREASADLRDLINGVLDLASIEADRMELVKEKVDVFQLINHAVSLVGTHARRKEMEIESVCRPNIGLFPLDKARVRQVLVLLLTNAIDYTQERGRVVVGARMTEQTLEIWVEDNGVGIDPADHRRVFEKFQHAEQSGARHGAGLGLSLVKSIIELHGGVVELSSQIAVGTRVSVQLPRDNGDD
jgi:signal transduction histidine kinase